MSHGAIQFMVYEELKSVAANVGAGQGRPRHEVSSAEIVCMGALSKLAATVITYPSQVRITRLTKKCPSQAPSAPELSKTSAAGSGSGSCVIRCSRPSVCWWCCQQRVIWRHPRVVCWDQSTQSTQSTH